MNKSEFKKVARRYEITFLVLSGALIGLLICLFILMHFPGGEEISESLDGYTVDF